MHGDAAGRVLGDRVRLGERVESLDELDSETVVLAVPPRSLPGCSASRSRSSRTRRCQRPPLVRPQAPRVAARRILASDAHWIFDAAR